MPKVKEIEQLIPKIYRRNYFDYSMFFFVMGQRNVLPALSIEKSLYNYFRAMGIDDYNIESALTTYIRIQKEFYEAAKTD